MSAELIVMGGPVDDEDQIFDFGRRLKRKYPIREKRSALFSPVGTNTR